MIPIASKQICRLQVKILKLPPLSSIGHYVVSDSFVTSRTAAHQAPLSMGLPKQEHCSSYHFVLQGNLDDPGIDPTSPAWQAGSSPLSHQA